MCLMRSNSERELITKITFGTEGGRHREDVEVQGRRQYVINTPGSVLCRYVVQSKGRSDLRSGKGVLDA
jgi:hypothetical protein